MRGPKLTSFRTYPCWPLGEPERIVLKPSCFRARRSHDALYDSLRVPRGSARAGGFGLCSLGGAWFDVALQQVCASATLPITSRHVPTPPQHRTQHFVSRRESAAYLGLWSCCRVIVGCCHRLLVSSRVSFALVEVAPIAPPTRRLHDMFPSRAKKSSRTARQQTSSPPARMAASSGGDQGQTRGDLLQTVWKTALTAGAAQTLLASSAFAEVRPSVTWILLYT